MEDAIKARGRGAVEQAPFVPRVKRERSRELVPDFRNKDSQNRKSWDAKIEGVNDENARELTKSACFPSSLFQDSTDGLSKQLMEEIEGLGLEEATTLPSATETIDEALVERPKPPIGRMAPNIRTPFVGTR